MMHETRKLNTILFADIAGYTSVMHSDEGKAMNYLQSFKKLIENTVPDYGGKIVQFFGDACLLSFDSATLGVKCAISLQKDFQHEKLPIRIGMHLGEVVFTDNNVFGDGVNIASRIESMGVPGSVLLSSAIREQIKNKNEFELISLGSFQFKNVPQPIEIFALENDGLTIPVRADIQGKFKDPDKKRIRLVWYIGIIVLLAVIFLGVNYFKDNSVADTTGKIAISTNSIAVLPLINLNGDRDLDYFSDGVSQEIIDELAKISSIRVSAFSTTYQYKNTTKQQIDIAKELGIQYLISGSSRIFEDNSRIKLSIELINPYTNERIWNRSFDEALSDAPSIQLDVAKKVADNLDIELTLAEKKDLSSPKTLSGEAFRLFLHAKSEINQLSPAGFLNGTRYLERALNLDPNYSQAHTLLAWRYTVGASADLIPGIERSSNESVALATPFIDQALKIDSVGSDIYLVRANLKLYSQNKIENAKKDVESAFEINSWPRIPTNYCICTAVSVYIASNDLSKAKEIAKLAKEIDPGHVLYDWDLGNIAMKEGDYLGAQHNYGVSAGKADIPFFNTFLGWSYYYSGQYDEALKYLTRAYENSPVPARLTVSALSNTYYKIEAKENADRYLQELLDRDSSGEPHLNLYIADVFLERNEINRALHYLEKGVENSDFGFAVFLSLIPKFRTLNDDPRFKEVLRKIQAPVI